MQDYAKKFSFILVYPLKVGHGTRLLRMQVFMTCSGRKHRPTATNEKRQLKESKENVKLGIT